MLVVHAMLLGSLQWTILTQVKLALSTGKIFAVHLSKTNKQLVFKHNDAEFAED